MTYEEIISKVLAASPNNVMELAESLVADIKRDGAPLEKSTILSIAAGRATTPLRPA